MHGDVELLLMSGKFEARGGHLYNLEFMRAIKAAGGARELAKMLGVSRVLIYKIAQSCVVPNVERIRARGDVKWLRAEMILEKLTGLPLEALFPAELLDGAWREDFEAPPEVQPQAVKSELQVLIVEGGQEEMVFDGERRTLIARALEEIKPIERRVIELRYRRELTLDEAGAVLGCSHENIRQIEVVALKKLRLGERGRLLAWAL